MNNDETKFFVINTESLWQEGEVKDGILVSSEGISIDKSSDYSYVETFAPQSIIPLSLDRDMCGVFYILDETSNRILIYDIKNRYSRWIPCLFLKNPVSIAVSDTDIYVVDEGDVTEEDTGPGETPTPGQPGEPEPSEQPEPPYSPPPPPPEPPYPPPPPPEPPSPPHPPKPPKPPHPPKPYHPSYPLKSHGGHDDDDDFSGHYDDGGKEDDVDNIKWAIYCFARVNGQIRWVKGVPPKARVAAPGGDYLYVLDINEKKVFKLGRESRLEQGEITLHDEKQQECLLTEPTDIASDPEGNFYILESQNKKMKILKFNPEGQLIQDISILFKEDAEYSNLAVESSDDIFLGLKSETAGESRGIVHISKSIKYPDEGGTYISKVFDSTAPGCQWHRVVLEADIPANTRVILSYLASDHEPGIDDDYRPGGLVNPKDAMIAGANGRYLRFKIELLSDETGKSTPLIKQLRVYFPRVTYLRYLPETYQEDAKKRDFLERFLSLFETFMSQSEEQVVDFTRYMDPSAVPGKFISWLSSWLAIAHDENWSLEKKRELIRQAAELYKIRGTPRIFRQIIKLFYGRAPIVVEPFQFRCIENSDIMKQMKDLFGFRECIEEGIEDGFEDRLHRFTVVVPPRWEDPDSMLKKAREVTAVERNTMQRIVDMEKPADTAGTLQMLQPWFYLDMHTYLGINTLLTKTEFVLGKTSVIGRDTVIEDKEKAGQLGRKSRIGIDLTLT